MFAQKRGYCTQNPAKAIGTTSVSAPEIEVYSPEEALLILRCGRLVIRPDALKREISTSAGLANS